MILNNYRASKVVIDEFVFDPNPNSKLALNFVKSFARFTSSLTNSITKKYKADYK